MSIVERCNGVRKRIPFAYWLAYDLVLLPFLLWGTASLSGWFALPGVMLVVAMFFDINEAIVKWARR